MFSGNEKKKIESNRWEIYTGRRFGNNSVKVFSNRSGKFLIVIKKYFFGFTVRTEKKIVNDLETVEDLMNTLKFESLEFKRTIK
jgi:hypothetical protein